VNLDTGWLDVVDVYVDKQRVIRPFPKDKDSRPVPLTSAAVEILRRVLDGRDLRKGCGVPHTDGVRCRSELVFRTVAGAPMTPTNFYRQVTRAAQAAKADVRSPYTARRGFGTWAAEGIDPFTLQLIMGHADMETTAGYVQMTEAARRKLLAARGEVPGLTVVRGADGGRGAAPGAESSKSELDSVGRDEGESAV
jgi:integrase